MEYLHYIIDLAAIKNNSLGFAGIAHEFVN